VNALVNSTCREELLKTVKFIITKKGKNEFTVKEVLQEMHKNNTIYKESTIRTHIVSKCCINAPSNHNVVFNDFERISYGLYRLISN